MGKYTKSDLYEKGTFRMRKDDQSSFFCARRRRIHSHASTPSGRNAPCVKKRFTAPGSIIRRILPHGIPAFRSKRASSHPVPLASQNASPRAAKPGGPADPPRRNFR